MKSAESGVPVDNKRRLSPSLKKLTDNERSSFTTAETIEEAQKGVMPTNTKKATEYAVLGKLKETRLT